MDTCANTPCDCGGFDDLINDSYGMLGQLLGKPYARYRPTTVNNPIAEGTFVEVQDAYFDPEPDFAVKRVSKPGDPIFYGAFDATAVMHGDYFVGQGRTYFVGIMPDYLPPECIECNDVLSFYRPTAGVQNSDPTRFYSGNTAKAGMGSPLGIKWPASVIQGTKGDRQELTLPNDTRGPWFNIDLPYFGNLRLQTGDQIDNAEGHRLVISSVEHTRHGFRLTAGYSEP